MLEGPRRARENRTRCQGERLRLRVGWRPHNAWRRTHEAGSG
ncbi:hypothetical protein ACWDBD_43065 [Streptomyces sp. NPDC001118]